MDQEVNKGVNVQNEETNLNCDREAQVALHPIRAGINIFMATHNFYWIVFFSTCMVITDNGC